LRAASQLGRTLDSLGEHEQARRLHSDTLTRFRSVLGENHAHTLRSASLLGATLRALGEHEHRWGCGDRRHTPTGLTRCAVGPTGRPGRSAEANVLTTSSPYRGDGLGVLSTKNARRWLGPGRV
jgi:hypothetical protein